MAKVMTEKKVVLEARCNFHPRYSAERRPKVKCGSCWLLFVLRHQLAKDGPEKLGSMNPYTYLIGDVKLEEACSGICVRKFTTARREVF